MTFEEDLENKYRIIADKENPEKWCVQLLDPEWHGIVLSYGEFSFIEPSDPFKSPLRVKFEYDILYVPLRFKGKKYNRDQEKDFISLIGDIIVDIHNKYLDSSVNNLKIKSDKMVLELRDPDGNNSNDNN